VWRGKTSVVIEVRLNSIIESGHSLLSGCIFDQDPLIKHAENRRVSWVLCKLVRS
jgi:hypothetical protein